MMTEATNKDELRERLRNLPRTSRTDTRYPIDAYEDDLVQIIIQYGLEQKIDELIRASTYVHNQQDVDSILARHEELTALKAKKDKS